jgi:hypothetical protein
MDLGFLFLSACSASGLIGDTVRPDAQPSISIDAPANAGETGGGSGSGGSNAQGGSLGTGGSTASGGSIGAGGSIGSGGSGGTVGRNDAAGVGGNTRDAGSPGADSAVTTWRPFTDASPWNSPIAATPTVDANSATLIADLANIAGQTSLWINLQQYSVPVYWVDSTTMPMVSVRTSLGGTGFRTGAASDSVAVGSGVAPIPPGAIAAAGTDRHLAIIDRQTKMEWGFWDAANGAGGWTSGEASTMDLAGNGMRPPERNSPWWAGHGPRACGFPLIAGLISADEIRAGLIEHALVLAYPHIRSRYYTPPARE